MLSVCMKWNVFFLKVFSNVLFIIYMFYLYSTSTVSDALSVKFVTMKLIESYNFNI